MLLGDIIPLYLFIAAGYLLRDLFKLQKETIAVIIIYLLAPLVVFYGAYGINDNTEYFLLPLALFICACLVALFMYFSSPSFLGSNERSLLGFMAGSSNTGYFGIPLTLSLFGDKGFTVAVIANIGMLFFEASLGYYLIAKAKSNFREAITKVVKLPIIYAFILGLLLRYSGFQLSEQIEEYLIYSRGGYIVLGMLMLGISLPRLKSIRIDYSFVISVLFAKIFALPLLMFLLVTLDETVFNIFDNTVHSVLLLLSATPVAINSVSYAATAKVDPEKAATAVLASTLVGSISVPIFITLFI